MKKITKYMMPLLLASVPFLSKAQTVQLMMQDGTSTIINSNFDNLQYTSVKAAEDLPTAENVGICNVIAEPGIKSFKVSFDYDKSRVAGRIVHRGLWYAQSEDTPFNAGNLIINDGDGAFEVKDLSGGDFFVRPVICMGDVIISGGCQKVTLPQVPTSCGLYDYESTEKDDATKTHELTFQITQYKEDYNSLNFFVAICSQDSMNDAWTTGDYKKVPVTPDALGRFKVTIDLDGSKYWEIRPAFEIKGERFDMGYTFYAGGEDPEIPNSNNTTIAYYALSGYLANSNLRNSDKDLEYLRNSQSATFIFPTNTATCDRNINYTVMKYVDPLSVYFTTNYLNEYYYDGRNIKGYAFQGAIETNGKFRLSSTTSYSLSATVAENRLYDLIRNLIVTEDITRGDKEYYKTVGGSTIRVVKTPSGYELRGGFQMEHSTSVFVPNESIYKKYFMGEPESAGKNYFIIDGNGDIPMPATKNLMDVLSEKVNYGDGALFYTVARLSSLFTDYSNSGYSPNGKQNLTLFNAGGDYTVFVPSNESVRKLMDDGLLPSEKDMEMASTYEERQKITQVIDEFVKSHIIQNSIYIGGTPQMNNSYNTFHLNIAKTDLNKLFITSDKSSMSIRTDWGTNANVLTTSGMYNIPIREIWCSRRPTNTTTRSTEISSSSYAVIHYIDNVLYEGCTDWK